MNQPRGDSAIDRQIGAALRAARMQAGIKQEELATSIGIDRTTLSNYERGSRSIPIAVLIQLALELRVPLSELVPRARAMEAAWAHPEQHRAPEIQQITQTLLQRPELASQVAEFLSLITAPTDLTTD